MQEVDAIKTRLENLDAKVDRILNLLENQKKPLNIMERHVHTVESFIFPFKNLLRLK